MNTRTSKENFLKETQERFDFFWKNGSLEKRYPSKTALGLSHLKKSYQLLESILEDKSPKKAVDIGAGEGFLIRKLFLLGVHATAIDTSSYPLNALKSEVESVFKCTFPFLDNFVDEGFDLFICTDVLAELPRALHRLALSELSRLIHREGCGLISTAIDIYSEDALECFFSLLSTEFDIEQIEYCHDRLYLFLLRFFQYPEKVLKAGQDIGYLKKALKKRRGLSHFFFRIFVKKPFYFFFLILTRIFLPPLLLLKQHEKLLFCCEKLSRAIFGFQGITHVSVRVKKKKLF